MYWLLDIFETLWPPLGLFTGSTQTNPTHQHKSPKIVHLSLVFAPAVSSCTKAKTSTLLVLVCVCMYMHIFMLLHYFLILKGVFFWCLFRKIWGKLWLFKLDPLLILLVHTSGTSRYIKFVYHFISLRYHFWFYVQECVCLYAY